MQVTLLHEELSFLICLFCIQFPSGKYCACRSFPHPIFFTVGKSLPVRNYSQCFSWVLVRNLQEYFQRSQLSIKGFSSTILPSSEYSHSRLLPNHRQQKNLSLNIALKPLHTNIQVI